MISTSKLQIKFHKKISKVVIISNNFSQFVFFELDLFIEMHQRYQQHDAIKYRNVPGGVKIAPLTFPSTTLSLRTLLCLYQRRTFTIASGCGGESNRFSHERCPSSTDRSTTIGFVMSFFSRLTFCLQEGSGFILQNNPIGSIPEGKKRIH